MAHWGKVLAPKPEALSSFPRTHMGEGESQQPIRLFFDHTLLMVLSPYTNIKMLLDFLKYITRSHDLNTKAKLLTVGTAPG